MRKSKKNSISNGKLIAIMLVLGSTIIAAEPVYADNNHTEPMDFSLIIDLNQTVGKDALNFVDLSRLDIRGRPYLSFVWSPDGTRLLISANVNVNTKGKDSNDPNTWGNVIVLYIVNGDGSNIERISWTEDTPYTHQTGENSLIQYPSWSSTGDIFLYSIRSGGNLAFGGLSHDLYIVDAKNFDLIIKKSLPTRQGPILEWSPKGNSLLYLGLDEQNKPTVFLFDFTKKNSEELPINVTRFGSMDLIWSPDGRKIGFEENSGLYILDVETRDVKNPFSTENTFLIDRRFWSPDSSKLIVQEITENAVYNVNVVDVRTGKSNKLTTLVGWASQVPGWFPDSDRILYVTASKNSTDNIDYTLYSMEGEGGDANPLFRNRGIKAFISPSGKYIGVQTAVDNRLIYILMNKDGSNKLQWNLKYYDNEEKYRGSLSIWHSKEDDLLLEIVNENQNNSLVVINASTKEIQHIPLPDPYIDKVSWSPTGRYLIINSALLELPEYDRPMRIETDGHMLVGTDVNISIKSASVVVDNASIMANGELIGTTNEKGVITHRFNEKGEVQLRVVKHGFSDADRIITVKDHIDERQDLTSAGIATAPVPAPDGTQLPGFTATAALVALISSTLCFELKLKRK